MIWQNKGVDFVVVLVPNVENVRNEYMGARKVFVVWGTQNSRKARKSGGTKIIVGHVQHTPLFAKCNKYRLFIHLIRHIIQNKRRCLLNGFLVGTEENQDGHFLW